MKNLFALALLFTSFNVYADFVSPSAYICVSKANPDRWSSASVERYDSSVQYGTTIDLRLPDGPHSYYITCDESHGVVCSGHHTAALKKDFPVQVSFSKTSGHTLEVSLDSSGLGLSDHLYCIAR